MNNQNIKLYIELLNYMFKNGITDLWVEGEMIEYYRPLLEYMIENHSVNNLCLCSSSILLSGKGGVRFDVPFVIETWTTDENEKLLKAFVKVNNRFIDKGKLNEEF